MLKSELLLSLIILSGILVIGLPLANAISYTVTSTVTSQAGGGNGTSSAKYRIDSSSIGNIAGLATSTNYKLSAGWSPTTTATSGGFDLFHSNLLGATFGYTGGVLSSISIPNTVSNPTLSLAPSLVIGAAANTAQISSQLTITSTLATFSAGVVFPPGTTISGPTTWNGVINLPVAVAPTVISSGFPNSNVANAITVGINKVDLTFNVPVKVILFGQAGMSAGIQDANTGSIVQVTTDCKGDTLATVIGTLAAGQACVINAANGVDLDIWTTHFSTFFSYTPTSSGGGISDTYPPTLTGPTFTASQYPLVIGNNNFNYPLQTSATAHATLNTGTASNVSVIVYDPEGTSDIAHVGLHTNIADNQNIGSSDTALIWTPGKPIAVYDPHGFFSSVTGGSQLVADKLQITFKVTFAKPMPKSAIIVRTWDFATNSLDTEFFSAWQAVGSTITPTPTTTTPTPSTTTPTPSTTTPTPTTTTPTPTTTTPTPTTTTPTPTTTTPTPTTTTPTPSTTTPQTSDKVMSAIKDWGGYSPNPITDSQLLSDLGVQGSHIPQWVAKTTKWVVDGSIQPQDFTATVKYLAQKGLTK